MSVVSLTKETFDEAELLARRSRLIDAMFRSGTLIGIGTCFYMGWFLYEFFTDIQVDLKNKMGNVVSLDWPPVDPKLRTDEASATYAALLNIDPKSVPTALESFLHTAYNLLLTPSGPEFWATLTGHDQGPGDPDYQKWSSFDKARSLIDGDGNFTGLTLEYNAVIAAWKALYKSGFSEINPDKSQHPVDAMANLVIHNKWYWGGVMGLASLPLISVAGDELQEIQKVGKG